MFDDFSIRAKMVLFLARLESGKRGAETIDLDDLLSGLLVEDQNEIPSTLARLGMQGELRVLPRHLPFLPSDTATSLLERIQESVPRSESIAQSADMPLSSNVEQILTVSSELRHSLQSKEVTPLHLLLAVLMNGSHTRVQALRNLGITEERVQNAIRTENQE